ncbi:hypothetical protein [Hymenobacter psychrotolerans]|uniref:Lipoprotein n=1 Tax=Hymenobacter psychrotolerans DSM 18569 TaxID=1121959 RepID=A0A1M7DRT3_9BACT|nr:hypothetical protein [Hymenobacter psychrotolerans]SHL82176.1 hypothetical protein SAMN02746009_03442 [Hymenobacter psychrotolerans DSM 18569]
MKKTLFLLSAVASLSLASCSDNKTATTDTTTSADGMTTTTTTTTTTAYSDEAIQQRADRIAAAMAAKMKFDDATREKVRTVYINRGKRLGELQAQYTTDTTGMAAAMRTAYSDADLELKTVFTDPTQYSAYEASRVEYMDDRYMDDASMSASSSDMSTTADNSGTAESGTEISKMKVKGDGDVKIKDVEGNKMKIDGDDGTMKTKTTDGTKTKVE